MPSKLEKIPLNDPFLDRRTKLLPCQKERVIAMHQSGVSIHALSRIFKVSRSLIRFVIYPERHALVKEQREYRGGSKQYYNRKAQTKSMRDHRHYKSKVLGT